MVEQDNAPLTIPETDARAARTSAILIDPGAINPNERETYERMAQHQRMLQEMQAGFFLQSYSSEELQRMLTSGYRIGGGPVQQIPLGVRREITKAWAEQAQGIAQYSTQGDILQRMRDGSASMEDLRTFWSVAGQQAQTIEAQARARYADGIQAATLRGLNADAITKEAQARYADTLQQQQVRLNSQNMEFNDIGLNLARNVGRGLSWNDLRSYATGPVAGTPQAEANPTGQPRAPAVPPVPGH